ncbi:MAG: PD40 domain-containing protein [Alphaproteobacteria bacterium]|nr:PD40 domain-containing protein [Alphaproteobacteria bacterium]
MSDSRRLILLTVKENVSLTALDAETGETAAVVEVGTRDTSKPHEITLSKDGTKAFVSLYGSADYGPNVPDNRIAVVDLPSMSLHGHVDLNLYKGPHALVTGADGKIWATVDHSRCVVVIDPDTLEIEHALWLEVPGHFFAMAPDANTLYASAKEYPVIVEIDMAAREITGRIPVPVGAQAIRVSADGKHLFVGDFHRPLLHVVDTAARAVVETHQMAGVPGWPFVSPDGKHLAVTTYNEDDNEGFLELFDADTRALRTSLPLPGEPFHVLFTDDSRHLYVVQADGDLPKVDIAAAEIVDGGFNAGGTMPEAMVYWEGPSD